MKLMPAMIILAILPVAGIFAQKPILITEDSISFKNHRDPGVIVIVPEVSFESFQKAWVKEMQSGTKSRAVYENGEWSIFGANLKSVSSTPVNIYSKVASQDSSVKFMVSIELKKDMFIANSTGETEMTKMKSYLKKFAKDQYIELAGDQLKVEENKLRDFEKDLSSFERDEGNLEKSIRSDERKIKEEQDNLSELHEQLNSVVAEIETQNVQFAQLEAGTSKDEKAKNIKDLEKKKKKLMNDINSAEKKISKANSDIGQAKSEIPKKQSLQREVKEQIDKQKPVVRKFEYKLNTIKAF